MDVDVNAIGSGTGYGYGCAFVLAGYVGVTIGYEGNGIEGNPDADAYDAHDGLGVGKNMNRFNSFIFRPNCL